MGKADDHFLWNVLLAHIALLYLVDKFQCELRCAICGGLINLAWFEGRKMVGNVNPWVLAKCNDQPLLPKVLL